jgi:DNA polymerase I-like protein with 3'-5' exonuclease and polymerase domains
MQYFITNRKHQVLNDSTTEVVNFTDGYSKFILYVKELQIRNHLFICLDTENNGVDPLTAVPLLLIVGDANTKFCFDSTSVDVKKVLQLIVDTNLCVIGQNLKYDYTVLKKAYGVSIRNLWDIMIAEQSITKNTNYRYGLQYIVERRLGLTNVFNKDVRNEFIGMDTKSIFNNRQIDYACNDLQYLEPVKQKIEQKIESYKQTWFFTKVELPLISILGDAELRGFKIDVDKWKENVKYNEDVKFDSEVKMDEIIRKERDKLPKEERIHLVGGKFDLKRHRYVIPQNYDIFDNPIPIEETYRGRAKKATKFTPNKGNINYSSSAEMIRILGRLKYKVPSKEGLASVPLFVANSKTTYLDYTIHEPHDRYSTQKDVIESYLTANPGCKEEEFYKILREYRIATKRIDSFGINFLNKISPVTGRIHTIFRQCFSSTGRLQSGGGKSAPDKINIQNIPAKKEYRTAFHDGEEYNIVTSDLSGAEVVIMADKANDKRLLELNDSDIHSYMAMSGWRNIYLYRAGMLENKWNDPKTFFKFKDSTRIIESLLKSQNVAVIELMDLYFNFVVSKTVNNETHRKPCKNLTFGSIYGCKPKKAGKTINVREDEGSVYITTIKHSIPETFKMVENNVDFAYKHGYLVLNTRSNSRVWFLDVLMELIQSNGGKVDRREYYEVDGQARNMPIQGTQADMIKEAMVEIGLRIHREKWDCHLLAQVHDELVYSYPKNMPEVLFTSDKGEQKMVSFGEFVALTMIEVSNRYLKVMKMHADYQIKDTWTK